MSKDKKVNPKVKPVSASNQSIVQDKTLESPKAENNSISFFYIKSFFLALVCYGFLWYVIVNNYVDTAEIEKLSKKQQNKELLGPEDSKKLLYAQKYFNSFDYKWLYNYKWVYHNLLNKNLKIQRDNDTLDLNERQIYKNGVEYQYIKILKDNTPKDAVILMPDQVDLALPEGAPANTPKFNLINDKAWCYYFLYPRKLVYDKDDSKDSLDGKPNYRKDPDFVANRKKVTHVAIVYGRGYEKLNYEVKDKEPYTVLPVNKADAPKKAAENKTEGK